MLLFQYFLLLVNLVSLKETLLYFTQYSLLQGNLLFHLKVVRSYDLPFQAKWLNSLSKFHSLLLQGKVISKHIVFRQSLLHPFYPATKECLISAHDRPECQHEFIQISSILKVREIWIHNDGAHD